MNYIYIQALILIVSIAIALGGAELTINASEKIGKRLKLSPLAIGFILIGFGTSLPELFISHISSVKGHIDVAIGNIIGSNIANLLFIMGISGLFTTISIKQTTIKRQLILHLILVLLLIIIIVFFKQLNIITTTILILFFSFHLFYTIKKQKNLYDQSFEKINTLTCILRFLSGVALLYIGSEFMVRSVTNISNSFNISEYVISAIFISIGTSFPELITAIITIKRKKDINLIAGNIIGSNIFNGSLILGTLGIYKIQLKSFNYELIILFASSIILLLMSQVKKDFSRLHGVLFLAMYITIIRFWILN